MLRLGCGGYSPSRRSASGSLITYRGGCHEESSILTHDEEPGGLGTTCANKLAIKDEAFGTIAGRLRSTILARGLERYAVQLGDAISLKLAVTFQGTVKQDEHIRKDC